MRAFSVLVLVLPDARDVATSRASVQISDLNQTVASPLRPFQRVISHD